MPNCVVCAIEATKTCSRCKTAVYCSVDHQRQDWKKHKILCRQVQQQQPDTDDQYTLHKREFDRIVKAYELDSEETSTAIADYVTGGEVTPHGFADKFGTTLGEAVVFLEWIKVGVKFREETMGNSV